MLFFLILLVHWIGCIWFMMVKTRDSWLPPMDLDGGWENSDFYDVSSLYQYTAVFYYAILLIVGNEMAPISTT